MRFVARVQNMSADELAEIIPEDTIARIKRTDPTPVFRAYVVGHEGEATQHLIGLGSRVFNWLQSAITKLVEKLRFGTKLFHDHEDSNSHEGRRPIGEIVGKALKTIRDRLSAIAVAYIYPEFAPLPLDVASIEADLLIDPKEDSIKAVNVDKITGIALGSSAVNKPGFSGATLLAQLRAFEKSQSNSKGIGNMTIDEIREFIKANNSKPSDLFGREILADDPIIKQIAKDMSQKAITAEWEHRTRQEETFDKKKEEYEKKINEQTAEISKLKLEGVKSSVDKLYAKAKESRKFTDRQSAFIESKLSEFKPTKPEEVDKEFEKFLDSQIDEFKKVSKVFGVEEKEEDKPKKGGSEADDKGQDIADDVYLEPGEKPLL